MVTKTRKNEETEFTNKAMNYMPRWAWASCAILLAFSFSIRQIGLDLTTPFNRVMTAYAIRIEKHQLCNSTETLEEITDRIIELEKKSHDPALKK